MDQIREPITNRAGYEQSGDRLLRSILAYEIASSRALLIEVCRRLRRLVTGFARYLPGLRHRLSAGLGSLARPGGNLTGLTIGEPAVVNEKRLQLLKEAIPSIARVAVLYDVTRVPRGQARR